METGANPESGPKKKNRKKSKEDEAVRLEEEKAGRQAAKKAKKARTEVAKVPDSEHAISEDTSPQITVEPLRMKTLSNYFKANQISAELVKFKGKTMWATQFQIK